jgi:hypothetical protein
MKQFGDIASLFDLTVFLHPVHKKGEIAQVYRENTFFETVYC